MPVHFAGENMKAKFMTGTGATTAPLKGKTLAILGYGNQGRSQALNFRDSGLRVVVGNIRDAAWTQARRDRFPIHSVAEATAKADVLFVLLPDEVAPHVWRDEILPNARRGCTVVFASGYNLHYRFIRPRADMDVLLLAPRMIGLGVRSLFERGRGVPILASVERDASGRAERTLRALLKAVGGFLPGGAVIRSSAKEETLADLFSEQGWAGILLYLLRASYEEMVNAGISPATAILELYASGELGEMGHAIRQQGLFEQLKVHSHTSQYGQLTRGGTYLDAKFRARLRAAMKGIRDGSFAREWSREQARGLPEFRRRWAMARRHSLARAEKALLAKLSGG
jgi:ketol-acid reductoisomerase